MIRGILLAALLAGTSSLAAAEQPVAPKQGAPRAVAPVKPPKVDSKKNEFDMAQFMAMFDKIFPAQPEPPAARLVAAHGERGFPRRHLCEAVRRDDVGRG